MNGQYFIIIRLAITIMFCANHTALSQTQDNIEPGDSRKSVMTNMGKPTGKFSVGSTEVLTYKRGMIKLQDGKVIKSDLVSLEEAAIRKAEQQQQQAVKAKAQKRQFADGNAIIINKNGDKNFAKLPASERLRFWGIFQKKYPSVPITKEIDLVKKEIDAEIAKEKSKKLNKIDLEITKTEELIETRVTATGLSRPALINARKELVALRKNLNNLNIKKKELTAKPEAGTIINKDKK